MGWDAEASPRNQSCNLEGSGHYGCFHSSLTLLAAQAKIISGSVSDNDTVPEGSNSLSSLERVGSPSDAAIDIWSSGGALKDTASTLHFEGPACSLGNSTVCEALEG